MPRKPTSSLRRSLLPRAALLASATSLLAAAASAQQPGASPAAPASSAAAAPAAPSSAPGSPPPPPSPPASGTAPSSAPAVEEPAPEAAAPSSSDNPYIPVVSERRSGVVLGLVTGLALSNASGSPVKLSRRNNPIDTGWVAGYGYTVFLGGAFTDWFSFHVGGTFSSATKNNRVAAGGAVVFGVEAWPLFSRGGIFRDLGLGIDFGTGSATVADKNNLNDPLADGSGFSMVRGSVIWDTVPLWRINLGPTASYEYRTTEVYDEHVVLLGLRAAFYGGP